MGGRGGNDIYQTVDFVKTNVKLDNLALTNCNKTISATPKQHMVI